MPKSLKEQNRWQTWLIIAANFVFLYAAVQFNVIRASTFVAAIKNVDNLLPVGLVVIVSIVLNGLLSGDNKARLVFLRWHYPLPGHRAFTEYGKVDPRIDLAALTKLHGSPLPQDPAEQNRLWYRFYQTLDNNPAVLQVHRDFLLMRDYTGLAFLFLVFFGAAGLYLMSSLATAGTYLLLLLIQYLVVRQAAANYGIRMVTTVLAQKAAAKVKQVRGGLST